MDTLEHIDEFESVFRRSEQEPFIYLEKKLNRVLLVLDEQHSQAEATIDSLKQFSSLLSGVEQWDTFLIGQNTTVQDLEQDIQGSPADLLITWRHLREEQSVPRHSLGVYVDMLTQATKFPVLLLPGSADVSATIQGKKCQTVLAATDHLAGDHRLVNYAAAATNPQGQLVLCHVEDDQVFERYLQAIERIPEVNSALVRTKLQSQLSRDVIRYMEAAQTSLAQAKVPIQMKTEVTTGHRLAAYKGLIDSHAADLLVMNTKDDDQLAMHGLAYAMSVEFVEIPQLLL
ncbi:MAG: hypothetical protein JKY95_10675 [Planctomycetaceae bacterium]|nr:hypothetical protein [Planctomycetaceae bacterium]